MTQLSLHGLRDPRYKRPTMTVDAAKGILDLTEDEVRELVDDGTLVAWDIRAPKAERPELRILTKSVAAAATNGKSEASAPRSSLHAPTLPRSAAPRSDAPTSLLLPKHTKPFLTGPEIKRALNCGRQHLINLVASKALPQLPGTTYRQGPKGWPVIGRDAFLAFLESRLIGAL